VFRSPTPLTCRANAAAIQTSPLFALRYLGRSREHDPKVAARRGRSRRDFGHQRISSLVFSVMHSSNILFFHVRSRSNTGQKSSPGISLVGKRSISKITDLFSADFGSPAVWVITAVAIISFIGRECLRKKPSMT